MQLLQLTSAVSNKAGVVAGTTLNYMDRIRDFALAFAPKVAGAIIILLIGSWVIGKIISVIRKIINARDYDPSLETFILSLVRVILNVLLFLSVAGILGVDTTAFSALIVGAGVAIGSALNGTLGNFAGGVMMLIFKPFRVGDMIEAQGVTGVVTEQGVFNTTVLTPDHKTVYVPNGPLSTGIITNYTTHGSLRVDLTMAIAGDQDIEKARRVAIDALLTHPRVMKTPSPEVAVLKVADGMVSLAVRPYCVQADYWDVYFGSTERVKIAWDREGIQGPIPQQVVYNK